MKRNNDHPYSNISSFKDFRREKELLVLKGKIIDAKLSLTYLEIKQTFSARNMIFSMVKEFVLPKISEFFSGISQKDTK
jgi:hypothetical protein